MNGTHPDNRLQHRYTAVGLHHGCVVGVRMDCVKQSGWQPGSYTRVSQRVEWGVGGGQLSTSYIADKRESQSDYC
jgi:hypothetical protein